jgi:formate hydrogenlyase subunit 4
MEKLIAAIVFVLAAPFVGGLLAGVDRVLTAKMQNRVGPPILQPFYDVLKLLSKESMRVNRTQNFYVFCFMVLIILTGAIFFAGFDLLLFLFALTLASVFLIIAGFSVPSPYSHVGTEREMLQVLAYEPMLIIAIIGMYQVAQTFSVGEIALSPKVPMILYLPGIFVGFLFVLTIKLRKSPFDLSTSHHAHQELVKGITTEFSGPTLAMIEVAHWYENVFLLGFVYLFFGWNPIVGAVAVALVYLFEIFLDNAEARVKWQLTVFSSWLVAIVLGFGNVAVLYVLKLLKVI